MDFDGATGLQLIRPSLPSRATGASVSVGGGRFTSVPNMSQSGYGSHSPRAISPERLVKAQITISSSANHWIPPIISHFPRCERSVLSDVVRHVHPAIPVEGISSPLIDPRRERPAFCLLGDDRV